MAETKTFEEFREELKQAAPKPGEMVAPRMEFSPAELRAPSGVSFENFRAELKAAAPSRTERAANFVYSTIVDTGINIKDSVTNLFKAGGIATLSQAIVFQDVLTAGQPGFEDVSAPLRGLREQIAPEEEQAGIVAGGVLDLAFTLTGGGIAKVAASKLAGAAARAEGKNWVRRQLIQAPARFLQGAGVGAQFSAPFTSPEERRGSLEEQLESRLTDVAFLATAEAGLVAPIGAGVKAVLATAPAQRVLGKLGRRLLQKKRQKILREIKDATFGTKSIGTTLPLSTAQFIRNIVPRAMEQLRATAEVVRAATKDVGSIVAETAKTGTLPLRGLPQKLSIGDPVLFNRRGSLSAISKASDITEGRIVGIKGSRFTIKFEKKSIKTAADKPFAGRTRLQTPDFVPAFSSSAASGLAPTAGGLSKPQIVASLIAGRQHFKKAGPVLREALTEEMAFFEGVMGGFIKKLGQEKGLKIDIKMLETLKQDAAAVSAGINSGRTPMDTLNAMTGLSRRLDQLYLQSVLTFNEVFTDGPLRTWIKAAKRVVAGKRPEPSAVNAVRNNMFVAFSAAQDTGGNASRFGVEEVLTRGLGDMYDLALGRATAGDRTAALWNTIRNFQDARPIAKQLVRGRFAAGVEIGGKAGASKVERAAEIALFPGLLSKGLVDTGAGRLAAMIRAYDIALGEARKLGLGGVERMAYIRQRVRGPWTGQEQFEILQYANEARFFKPRGPGFVRFTENPFFQLLGTPFANFGTAWLEFLGGFVPALGGAPAIGKFLRNGKISEKEFISIVTRQLTGLGAIGMFNQTLYDKVDFDDPGGLKLRDLEEKKEATLMSPWSDVAMLTAVARGDLGNAAKAAQFSGVVLLGGGIATKTVTSLMKDPDQISARQVSREMARLTDLLIPGQAAFKGLVDIFLPDAREPLLSEPLGPLPVTPLPFVTGTIFGRERISAGGETVASLRRPAVPFGGPALDLRGTDIGRELDRLGIPQKIPASFGIFVSKRDMSEIDVFIEKARRHFPGVSRINLGRRPTADLRTDMGRGLPRSLKDWPEEAARYYMLRRAEKFADFVVLNNNNPLLWSMREEEFERYKNSVMTAAASYAKNQTLRQFPNVLTTGDFLPMPDEVFNPVTHEFIGEE